jgi:hypothetical protein
VPPLLVQAVAIRGSRQADLARALLRFLATGDGNAAFRGCGRSAER